MKQKNTHNKTRNKTRKSSGKHRQKREKAESFLAEIAKKKINTHFLCGV